MWRLGLLALVIGIGSVLTAMVTPALAMLFPFKEPHRTTPAEHGLSYEELSFRTPTGARLSGWFIPQPESKGRTVVVLHGICSNKSRFVGCARELHERGFNVLLVDLRGHGKSSRGMTTYGHLEARDMGYVVDQLCLRADVDPLSISLMGHSMGAAIALQTLSHPGVKAVVADSAFTDMGAMLKHRGRQFRLPAWPLIPLTRQSIRLVARFDILKVSPSQSLASHDKPVFLVHGTGDRSIPYAHSVSMAQASPHARLWTVPEAGHLQASQAEGYFDAIAGFLGAPIAA